MAQEANVPRHRHDGSSPLPLGMDASTPPVRWSGVSTVWPNDFRTGWSYCVTIPSWRTMSQKVGSDGNSINPTVFYRVQIGVQSPQGFSTIYGLFRRFNDFLKLHAALKRTFPEKKLPAAPPKNTLMRINSSQALLQERRRALQLWIEALLADMEISRSVPIASFFELEAAARFAVNTIADQQPSSTVAGDFSQTGSRTILAPNRTSGVTWTEGGPSIALSPYSSGVEDGSDGAFEITVSGTPSKAGDDVIELEMGALALDQEAAISAADDGVGNSGQEGRFQGISAAPTGRMEVDDVQSVGHFDDDGDSQRRTEGTAAEAQGTPARTLTDLQHTVPSDSLASWHRRKESQDSLASNVDSVRGNDSSACPSVDGSMVQWEDGLLEIESALKGVGTLSPAEQRSKLRRLLMLMQSKILGAKADREDLTARLKQETLVKEFLAIKVRDLEGELDNTRRKTREVWQQAVSAERERVTSLQWELEESKNALMNFEESSGLEKELRSSLEDAVARAEVANEEAQNEIAQLKEKQVQMQTERDFMEAQARADKKVLVKEVKSLRNAQADLKREMESMKRAKVDLENFLQEERQTKEISLILKSEFLREAKILRQRLLECNVDYLAREEDRESDQTRSGGSHVLDLLMTSDSRIGLLLAEAQLLSQQRKGFSSSDTVHANGVNSNEIGSVKHDNSQDVRTDCAENDTQVRQTIIDLIIDNAQLQRAINHSLTESVLSSQRGDVDPVDALTMRRGMLSKILGTS